MGDAWKSKRLLVVAAVCAGLLAGLGAAGQAGLLSRAESGDTTSRAAGAAVGAPDTPGTDVIAVSETTATSADGQSSASATLLRVGNMNIGETPNTSGDVADTLGPLLNGQPTEALVDAGCDFDTPESAAAPACVALLYGGSFAADGEAGALYAPAVVRAGGQLVYVLPSAVGQDDCEGQAIGAVVYVTDEQSVDLSQAENECPA